MRTKFTPNVFEVVGDACLIHLYNIKNELIAKAVVDAADFDLVKNHKWHLHRKRNGKPVAVESVISTHKVLKLHHLFLQPKDDLICDHIDQNPLNNRRPNLRLVTLSQSNHNRIRHNVSGYTGVDWSRHNQLWRARVKCNGKQRTIGHFSTAIEAHEAYKREAKMVFGSFFNSAL